MERPGPVLRNPLLKEIIAHHDAHDVLNLFYEMCRKLTPDRNVISLRREFLCATVKNEHVELLKLLLSKSKFRDLDSRTIPVSRFPRPFFLAIETGNASLVSAFLRVGSPVRLKEATGTPDSGVPKAEEMSALEYACTFDNPDVFKIIVAADKDCKDKSMQRTTPLHYACHHAAYRCVEYLLTEDDSPTDINTFCSLHEHRWVTPLMVGAKHGTRMIQLLLDAGASAALESKQSGSALHAVMRLSSEWYDKPELSELRQMVRLLLDVGARVEQEDCSGENALYVLISQIDEAKCADLDVATHYRSAVTEITRMLLASGSPTDSKPLEHLLKLIKLYKPSRLLNLRYVQTRRNLHLLVAQLFEIILKHQTDRLLTYANECYYEILVVSVAGLMEKLAPILDDDCHLNALYNTIIDCHSEVFRCLMVAGAGADTFKTVGTVVFSNTTVKSEVFLKSFVAIAHYSSQPGRTLSFMRKILNALSTSQVDTMLRSLSARLVLTTDSTAEDNVHPEKSVFVNEAMEWLRGVQAPPCLKHLSRRAITRAFPNEVLCGVSTLGLPKDLEEYLLLRY